MRFYHFLCLLSLYSVFLPHLSAQLTCKKTLQIRVKHFHNDKKLSNVNIVLKSKSKQFFGTTNNQGKHEFHALCPNIPYHISLSCIGYERLERNISLHTDSILTLFLNPTSELIQEVDIRGYKHKSPLNIGSLDIQKQANKSLSELLENIPNIRSLKSSGSIAKPIIDGLYGNRITLINHNVQHEGQQWGNDHDPEISSANVSSMSLVQGAQTLLYTNKVSGGLVLIKENPIAKDKHIHGKLSYIHESVSNGSTGSAELSVYNKFVPFKLSFNLSKKGDLKTPKYLLTNTSLEQNVIALTAQKQINQLQNRFYYSYFNKKQAILKGSQIGNLTDLQSAFSRSQPFFTQPHRTYSIQPPYQNASHHLISIKSTLALDSIHTLILNNSFQHNERKEFDVRRGGRSNIPELWLTKQNFTSKLTYAINLPQHQNITIGSLYSLNKNVNQPTGIRPILPNYLNHNLDLFGLYQKTFDSNILLNAAFRYGIKDFFVAYFPVQSLSTTFKTNTHWFQNYSLALDISIPFTQSLSTQIYLLNNTRNPFINELYSNGLHQGVSGIEEGNIHLNTETNYKAVLSASFSPTDVIKIEASGFFHYINNYIFLKPQKTFRLTIRGAFPVYQYTSTLASIAGFNIGARYKLHPISLWSNYSFIEGNDLSNKTPLVYMPSNQIKGGGTYHLKSFKQFENNQISFNYIYTFKQTHLNQDQDFLEPPDGFLLLNLDVSTTIRYKHLLISPSLEINNLLNNAYKDYLNRLRYYAYEPGINLLVKLNITF